MTGIMRRWRIALALLLLGALGGGVVLGVARHTPRPGLVHTAFWDARFPNLAGQPQPLAQWRGRPLVVNFWAPWCAPCREEIPDLAALYERHRTSGVSFVGLAVDAPAAVRAFVQRTPMPYPVLVGGGGAHTLARELGNSAGALPYTVVLNARGEILFSHLGRVDAGALERALRKIGA